MPISPLAAPAGAAPCCGTSSGTIIAPAASSTVSLGEVDSNLARLTAEAMTGIFAEHPADDPAGPILTRTDRFLMLVALNGVSVEDPAFIGRTFAIGIDDPQTGRLEFQTVPVQNFHRTPFKLGTGDEKTGILEYDASHTSHPRGDGSLTSWPVTFGGNFRRQRSHHFNQSERNGRVLPVSTISNPYTACSEACDGCSRVAMGAFRPAEKDYVAAHVRNVRESFLEKFPGLKLGALKYVSLMTGCQPTPELELDMFLKTMSAYREAGFDPGFIVFTSMISSAEHMFRLREAGAFGFGRTMETVGDDIRIRIWGQRKGNRTFAEHADALRRARDTFQIAEATLVLGQDGFDELMKGIDTLGEMGITMVGNVLRAYNETQLATIHPDVWKLGFGYFTDSFNRILNWNSRRLSSARYMRDLGLAYIGQRDGRSVADVELPYKYRG